MASSDENRKDEQDRKELLQVLRAQISLRGGPIVNPEKLNAELEEEISKNVEHMQREWDRLDSAKNSAQKGFDNVIFVVSTGAFALTVTYVTGFTDRPFLYLWILVFSWFALALAIGCHALSYQVVSAHTDFVQKKMNQYGALLFDKRRKEDAYQKVSNAFGRWTVALNVLSGLLLTLGITSLLMFATLNLLTRNNEAERQFRMDDSVGATSSPMKG